jgi:hypothetical protein
MQISVRSNVKGVQKNLTRIQKKQIPYATSVALNNTSKKLVTAEQKQMVRKLDRPRPQTIKALRIFKYAKKTSLSTRIGFPEWADKFMSLQVFGGIRNVNSTVVPMNQYGGALNKYGSIPGRRAKGWANKRKQFFVESKGKTLLMRPSGRDDQVVVGVITSNPVYKKKFPFFIIAQGLVKRVFPREMDKGLKRAIATMKPARVKR